MAHTYEFPTKHPLNLNTKYLTLSGANANQNINIGTYSFSAGTLYATDTGASEFNDGALFGTTLTVDTGSITDSTGAISFGDENLTTTGTLGAGALTATSLNTHTIPAGTGTLALTSNLTSYVPYTGADKNVNLGANNFTIDTNVLHVASNTNRVGIGTTTPQNKLNVLGDVNFTDSSNGIAMYFQGGALVVEG